MRYDVYFHFARTAQFVNDIVTEDVKKAVKFASCNLLTRHKIEVVKDVEPVDNVHFLFSVESPVPIKNAMHFRGIGAYLLRECGDDYRSLTVGKRLLSFIIIEKE